MNRWTLAQHGDHIEREWGAAVSVHFPRYEILWAKHVVPLTYRVSDPSCIYLRSSVRKELEALATSNYAVFVHLAACHQQLKTDPELFAAEGLYSFYSRLYSAGESVERFLGAVRVIVCEYEGVAFGGKRLAERLEKNGAPGLSARFKEAFEIRTKDYRRQQVHDWGFPVIEHRIPRREYLSPWLKKGLGALDAFLMLPDAAERLATEFVDAIQQASEDLEFVECVVNEVWDMALREIDGVKDKRRYQLEQGHGSQNSQVPPRIQPPVTTSGTVSLLPR